VRTNPAARVLQWRSSDSRPTRGETPVEEDRGGHDTESVRPGAMRSCPDCLPRAPAAAYEEGVDRARLTYAVGEHPIGREVELLTLGSDFGANGYATLAEVSALPGLLGLGPGRRLLDVGSGQGWPGLYLARQTGCRVILTDVPFEGLATATRRASREDLGGRAWALAARGQMLPLRAGAFDAVIHTDVLCCLRPKQATLRATFRALGHGGRTAFTAIFPAAGLAAADTRRAIEAGPPNCGLRTSYPSLLRSVGFVDVEERDLTVDYLVTVSRKLEVAEQFAGDMIEMLGRQEYERRQAERRLAIAAIEAGLLRRCLFLARRPEAGSRNSRSRLNS
jgi:ubiquinone/menaquinone biosynthesis C-methylase UbiE